MGPRYNKHSTKDESLIQMHHRQVSLPNKYCAEAPRLCDSTNIQTGTDDKEQRLYKTEICRNYEELHSCRYGQKCRYAHGKSELRSVERHPRYKTVLCRTFEATGGCPYGIRCTFLHQSTKNTQLPSPPQENQVPAKEQAHASPKSTLNGSSSMPPSSDSTPFTSNSLSSDVRTKPLNLCTTLESSPTGIPPFSTLFNTLDVSLTGWTSLPSPPRAKLDSMVHPPPGFSPSLLTTTTHIQTSICPTLCSTFTPPLDLFPDSTVSPICYSSLPPPMSCEPTRSYFSPNHYQQPADEYQRQLKMKVAFYSQRNHTPTPVKQTLYSKRHDEFIRATLLPMLSFMDH